MTSAAILPGRAEARRGARAPLVYVVDDDVSVRESLELLIRSAGWEPEMFASAGAFLDRARNDAPACVILDVSLPDLDGLAVQRRIAGDRRALPVIFVTGHGDVLTSVQAMKGGAVEFLTKPFDPSAMRAAVDDALTRSRAAVREREGLRELEDRYASLTPREREVMALVVSGHLNKQVGAELAISEITVKAHRGKVMRKMQARSFAELVQMADRMGRSATNT